MWLFSWLCHSKAVGHLSSTERTRHGARRRRLACSKLTLEALEDRRLLSVFTVLNTSDAGPGSLRQAILDANVNPGIDTIAFNVGGGGVQTIQPTSALPIIADPVLMDGTTQPGFAGTPLIELDGAGAGVGANGLTIIAGSSTAKGLVIHSFGGNGIALLVNGGNQITGNYIGTDVTGTVRLFNVGSGVYIVDAPNNTIGGTAAGARNILSGNGPVGNGSTGDGVTIQGAGATGNVVQGNYIGTDVSGNAALGNARKAMA
jgi:hypothetical protein